MHRCNEIACLRKSARYGLLKHYGLLINIMGRWKEVATFDFGATYL